MQAKLRRQLTDLPIHPGLLRSRNVFRHCCIHQAGYRRRCPQRSRQPGSARCGRFPRGEDVRCRSSPALRAFCPLYVVSRLGRGADLPAIASFGLLLTLSLPFPRPVLHTAHRATSGASTPPSASVVRDDARLVAGRTAPAPLTSTSNRTLTFLGRIRPAPAAKCLRQISTGVRRHHLILEQVWRWPLDAAASSFQRVPVIAQRRHFGGCFVRLRSENGARMLMPRVHTCTSAHCVQCIQDLYQIVNQVKCRENAIPVQQQTSWSLECQTQSNTGAGVHAMANTSRLLAPHDLII